MQHQFSLLKLRSPVPHCPFLFKKKVGAVLTFLEPFKEGQYSKEDMSPLKGQTNFLVKSLYTNKLR